MYKLYTHLTRFTGLTQRPCTTSAVRTLYNAEVAEVVFEPIKELHNICLTQLQDTSHDHANTTNRSANRFACWRGRMKYKSPTYEKCSTIVPTGTVICHSTSYDCVITSYLPTCMTKNCMAGS